jgi:hypothetical protein
MKPEQAFLSILACAASGLASAQKPTLGYLPSPTLEMKMPFTVVVGGVPGDLALITFSSQLGSYTTPWGALGIIPDLKLTFLLPPIGQNGTTSYDCNMSTCDFSLTQGVFYGQAITFEKPFKLARGISDVAPLEWVTGDACPPCAMNATADPKIWGGMQGTRAFWLSGCPDAKYAFTSPGRFVEYGSGTAHLTGEIAQVGDPNRRYAVDIWLSGRESLAANSGVFPPPMSPKLNQVLPSALAANGGPIDTSLWHYYTSISGTLKGAGTYAGTNFDVALRGAPAQVGWGGSLKNANYGLSSWLTLTRTSGGGCSGPVMDGDMNFELDDCP